MITHPTPVWSPSRERIARSLMETFRHEVSKKFPNSCADYWQLHAWSVAQPEAFWSTLASFTGIKWHHRPERTYQPGANLRSGTWFPGGTLNFAENLLPDLHSKHTVILSVVEGREQVEEWSAADLWTAVARCQALLKQAGVQQGDRVAGVVANTAETIVAMLAAASLGAIWASCSPDFGKGGIVDRLGQIAPKVLFYTAAYAYNGKVFSCHQTIESCLPELPSVSKVVQIAVLPGSAKPQVTEFHELPQLFPDISASDLTFTSVAFGAPQFILFSSGTTGVPKCIVHTAGGTLLQHQKELMLHGDIQRGDRLFYFTTCGWMMWNWMVSALSVGASLVLYEGSVSFPDLNRLWHIIRDHGVTHFGTSPKFLAACQKAAIVPRDLIKGASLRTLFSTGSPLLPEQFDWVYEQVGEDLHLASISGGTDIVSCFMLGVPTVPVYAGEIQAPGLGMAVEAWDQERHDVRGQKGELVCTKPFVSMPWGFWNDPKGEKYFKAYFAHYYPECDVWRHGDFIERTPHGGVIVYGRSDATLNPGGVRIGTAEIYRQIESLSGVVDSLAIGYEVEGDVEIWLFVKLAPHTDLTSAWAQEMRHLIRSNLTPRHVPKRIFAVSDIPYTRSGKKLELAVKQAVQGQTIENQAAIANPECLAQYHHYQNLTGF